MAEYIERDKVLTDIEEAMKFRGLGFVFGSELTRYIKRQIAADVAPVVHGRWVAKTGRAMCSACADECWADSALEYSYCPNCGARMDGDG